MLWDVKEIDIDKVDPSTVPAKAPGIVGLRILGRGFVAGVTGFLMREGCEQSQSTIIPLIDARVVEGDFDIEAGVATYFAQPGSYNLFLWNPPQSNANKEIEVDPEDTYVAVKRGALTVTAPEPAE
jgi:hypothetical protein